MLAAASPEHPPSRWAATDPIGEVADVSPVRSEIERAKYQNPRQGQRRPLNQKRTEKEPHKPSDPEHKVDDYA